MKEQEKISAMIHEIMEDPSLFLVDLKVSEGKVNKVTVMLDKDNGITIDECAIVSRKLAERIEAENMFESAYTLEVTSPGLDEPLKLKRQYINNKGRQLSVMKNSGEIVKGELEDIKEDSILLKIQDKKKKTIENMEIAFEDIKKTNVLVSFR